MPVFGWVLGWISLWAQATSPVGLTPADGQPARAVHVVVRPAEPIEGQRVVIEVQGGLPGDRISGSFLDRKLRFYIDRYQRVRALGAAGLNSTGSAPLVLKIQPPQGEAVVLRRSVRVRAGSFDEQPLRVNRKFVEPPAAVGERIRRERAEFQRLFEAEPTRRMWRGSFVWPRRGTVTSRFGLRRTFNGKLQSRHLGLDIDGSLGRPVRAIGAGRVVLVAQRYYSGLTVVIDHGLRLFSMYYHLSAAEVEPGQRISKGQRIGRVGRSGRVTGPHLHLSVKVEGQNIDPLSLFGFDFDAGPEAGSPTR